MKFDMASMPEIESRIHCRATLEAAKRFYSDPENVKKYKAWKAKKYAGAS